MNSYHMPSKKFSLSNLARQTKMNEQYMKYTIIKKTKKKQGKQNKSTIIKENYFNHKNDHLWTKKCKKMKCIYVWSKLNSWV